MKSNPKTIAGVVLLVILAIALGFLLSRLIPTIGEVQREKSLTPTPLPEIPDNVMIVTPDPAAVTAEPILRRGSPRTEEVRTLQARLHDLGYYTGEIDGQFGYGTEEAVIDFQQTNGLEADGIVGEDTKAILYSVNAKPKSNE